MVLGARILVLWRIVPLLSRRPGAWAALPAGRKLLLRLDGMQTSCAKGVGAPYCVELHLQWVRARCVMLGDRAKH